MEMIRSRSTYFLVHLFYQLGGSLTISLGLDRSRLLRRYSCQQRAYSWNALNQIEAREEKTASFFVGFVRTTQRMRSAGLSNLENWNENL